VRVRCVVLLLVCALLVPRAPYVLEAHQGSSRV
jgi:hypothetical protein